MIQAIEQMIEEHFPEMVDIRRYLHEHPELSFQEYETANYIASYYDTLGIPYERNVGGNGIIATLQGGKPGKTVAFRADFDALPIQDEKDVPYKSKNDGVMHACGHDGHTATLLVLAKVLKQFSALLPGTVVFLHQHAEEQTPGGAISIVESGKLNDVDVIFGNHLWATSPLGVVETRSGVFMAGTDRFTIEIKGKGGHGAYPHETKDALVIGTSLVNELQQIVSRRMNPLETAVVTVGKFTAGTSFNVIADKAEMIGTVRYLNKDVQQQIRNDMEQIVKGVCATHGVDYEFTYAPGYPPVVNHEQETNLLLEAAKEVDAVKKAVVVQPQMGGEDFAYYVQRIPGVFFFTGAKKEDSPYPHHHALFDFDESAMTIAAKIFVRTLFRYQRTYNS